MINVEQFGNWLPFFELKDHSIIENTDYTLQVSLQREFPNNPALTQSLTATVPPVALQMINLNAVSPTVTPGALATFKLELSREVGADDLLYFWIDAPKVSEKLSEFLDLENAQLLLSGGETRTINLEKADNSWLSYRPGPLTEKTLRLTIPVKMPASVPSVQKIFRFYAAANTQKPGQTPKPEPYKKAEVSIPAFNDIISIRPTGDSAIEGNVGAHGLRELPYEVHWERVGGCSGCPGGHAREPHNILLTVTGPAEVQGRPGFCSLIVDAQSRPAGAVIPLRANLAFTTDRQQIQSHPICPVSNVRLKEGNWIPAYKPDNKEGMLDVKLQFHFNDPASQKTSTGDDWSGIAQGSGTITVSPLWD
ncbi:MAG: hypothetical protein ACRC5A_16320 [Enterobacteriaceae bacterium]